MKVFAIIFSFCALCTNGQIYAQNNEVLMTIGDETITTQEFLNVYHKNNIKGEPIDQNTLEEYLELYINFKLKVKEAEYMGLDTVQEFKRELAGYRNQLAQTLLTDKEVTEQLIKEAYKRMQKDIRASHILIRLDRNALPEDTLKTYNKIMALRDRIKKGESFADVATEASEDQSARDSEATDRRPAVRGNAGDLGYFTALDMLYPFETGAYNTKVGEVSMPIRTNFGYHLIKVTDKKPAMGRVQVAHILKSIPRNADENTKNEKKEEINNIYKRLQNGESFADLAQRYSDDKGSGANGGVLPWFGVNRMVPDFIVAVSKLDINEISKPIKTMYGYHIIKLLDQEKPGTFEEMYPDLKSRIARDPRAKLSKELFIEKVKKENNFKEYDNALADFFKIVDDSIFYGRWDVSLAKDLDKKMFSIGNKVITQQDFAKYLDERQSPRTKTNVKAYLISIYNDFVNEKCMAYEDSMLEEKNPEFRALMQEYRDGILLFELTDRKVWSKAIKDTAGIKEFYQTIKHNYLWPERLNATIFICNDEKTTKRARRHVARAARRNTPNQVVIDRLNRRNPEAVKIESNFYAKGDSKIIDEIEWQEGLSKNINIGNDVVFVMVYEVLQPEPKDISEVRGLVTAEYQNYLEKKWIEELREKYPVKVNRDVFLKIIE